MELSKNERLLLINQYKILSLLDKDRDDYYNELVDILENGYAIFYSEVDSWVFDNMPEEEGKFVLDVLSLYRSIENTKRSTQNEELLKHGLSYFHGFDGNNETKFMSFSRFLIEKQGKFQEQKQYFSKNDNLNSHTPMFPTYNAMLRTAETIDNKWNLSAEDALRILNSGL